MLQITPSVLVEALEKTPPAQLDAIHLYEHQQAGTPVPTPAQISRAIVQLIDYRRQCADILRTLNHIPSTSHPTGDDSYGL